MEEEKKLGLFARLKRGLTKTRDSIVGGIDSLFHGFSSIDEEFYEELEEILIMGDMGVNTSESVIASLKQKVKENHIKEPIQCKQFLIDSIKERMLVAEDAYDYVDKQTIIMVIGVNGVGKTTTIGKLAWKLKDHKNVLKLMYILSIGFSGGYTTVVYVFLVIYENIVAYSDWREKENVKSTL